MYSLSPSLNTPRLLTADLALLQVGELPEVVDSVQVANLHKPRTNAFHHLATGGKSPTPVGLPLQQVARVQGVRPELEQTTKTAGWGGWPERELLHEGGLLALDQAFELAIEISELGVFRDVVKGGMVAFVALVFPDMDYPK